MKKYGLIGYPLGHSFSKKFFTEKFGRENLKAEYVNFEIPEIALLADILRETENLGGLNVTIPYKEQVMPFLDEVDSEARTIGAVNVIRVSHSVEGEMRLKGYNSDVTGFQQSIVPMLGEHHKKALVLGSGGASKAVVRGLANLGIESKLVSRTRNGNCLAYSDLTGSMLDDYQVVVNTTSLGTYPNVDDAPDIPYTCLTDRHLLYDLVYNPAETRFLKNGKMQGAQIKNGQEMLELQAMAAWEIWNNADNP